MNADLLLKTLLMPGIKETVCFNREGEEMMVVYGARLSYDFRV